MKIISVLAFCLFALQTFSQDFNWQTKIEKSKLSGFHRIQLSPEITSKLNSDFSDIRIYDNDNQEIPYLQKTEMAITYSQLFNEYKIISNNTISGSMTRIILENEAKNKVNNVSLVIKNSDVQKKIKLYGSDDLKKWYIIKDDYIFNSMYSSSETTEIKLMNFPLSDYAYFKIEVDDSKNAPINILKVGYYDDNSELGKYIEIPKLSISQTDSAAVKSSFIKINFDSEHYLNKLELNFGGPLYYLRNARISYKVLNQLEDESYFETLQSFEISSNNSTVLYFDKIKTSEILLIIENEDNQPIKLEEVKAYQLNTYLTANFDSEKTYLLKFGDQNLSFPNYDLQYFQDNIPAEIPVLSTGELLEINGTAPQQESSSNTNKIILWAVIAVLISFFGFLTFKMVKDMK